MERFTELVLKWTPPVALSLMALVYVLFLIIMAQHPEYSQNFEAIWR